MKLLALKFTFVAIIVTLVLTMRSWGGVLCCILMLLYSIRTNARFILPSANARIVFTLFLFAFVNLCLALVWLSGLGGELIEKLRQANLFLVAPSGVDSVFGASEALSANTYDEYVKKYTIEEAGRIKARIEAANRKMPEIVSAYAHVSASIQATYILLLSWISLRFKCSVPSQEKVTFRGSFFQGRLRFLSRRQSIFCVSAYFFIFLGLQLVIGNLGDAESRIYTMLSPSAGSYRSFIAVLGGHLLLINLSIAPLFSEFKGSVS